MRHYWYVFALALLSCVVILGVAVFAHPVGRGHGDVPKVTIQLETK